MQLESFASAPLTDVVRAYLYQQYFDDPDLQGFITAANSQFQGYLDWFTSTPLSVYTNSTVSDALLDWIGLGVYGIRRPVVSSGGSRFVAGFATSPYAHTAYLVGDRINNETAAIVDDDTYKRVLTWYTYLGDGRHTSIHWLRRRVARFIFGFGGTDVPADRFASIGITRPALPPYAAYNTQPYNTQPYGTRNARPGLSARSLQIAVPTTPVSAIFKSLIDQGYLALPFQVRFSVTISS